MKEPLVSVIINTYNYEKFIERAIESAINQDFPPEEREIIVIDDGSADSTPELLRKYGSQINYIHKSNGGQASALNAGIEAAKGEIIAFLDADDYWTPDKLRSVTDVYNRYPSVDFVYHNLTIVDRDENRIKTYLPYDKPEKYWTEGRAIDVGSYLKGRFHTDIIPTSAMTVRRGCLNKFMPIPEDYRICADTYIHNILPFYSREYTVIKEPLGLYNVHGENLFENDTEIKNLDKNKLSLLISVYGLLLRDISLHCNALGHKDKGLLNVIRDFIAEFEYMRGDRYFRMKLMYLKKHFKVLSRILREEGISKFLIYSYRHRSSQVKALVNSLTRKVRKK